jgi:hypothetical protein
LLLFHSRSCKIWIRPPETGSNTTLHLKDFQMLQEAYQRGEWVGDVPQFKLPKAFRKADLAKLPMQDSAADTKGADKTTPTGSSKSKLGRSSKNAEARRTKLEYLSG